MAVREWGDEIVFLHKIVEGGTDRSYGIHVARLAGLPPELLSRAESVLEPGLASLLDVFPPVVARAAPATAPATAPAAPRPSGPAAAARQTPRRRMASVTRKTAETSISVSIQLDGEGKHDDIDTGIGFLDHMLELFARHGGFDLTLHATGDLDVDQHHTVEDVGITLGEAVLK